MPLQRVGQAFEGRPAPAIWFDRATNRKGVSVFGRLSGAGDLGYLEFQVMEVPGGGFAVQPQSPSGQWTPLRGAQLRGNPAVVDRGSSAFRVFLRGLDDRLFIVWSNGSEWFGPEDVPAGQFVSEMSAVEAASGHISVFVRGLDSGPTRGQLWRFFQPAAPFTRMGDLRLEPLGGDFMSNPVAVALPRNVMHVYLRGLDNFLWRRCFDGAAWRGWQRINSGEFDGDPAVVKSWDHYTDERFVGVFIRNTAGRIGSLISGPIRTTQHPFTRRLGAQS